MTALAFLPALRNGFVNWDDDHNILFNPAFRGLGPAQLRWMWTTFYTGLYVPLTWMSLGLDYVAWGMDPAGYHLTSVLLHAANALVFYAVCRCLFRAAGAEEGSTEASVVASLLFAVHPLRVESVVWVTERRDVLSGLFVLSAVFAYLKARTVGAARVWSRLAVLFFAAGLLSKPTCLPLAAVLLVLDVYPLDRFRGKGLIRGVFENTPYLLLAFVAGAGVFVATHAVGNLKGWESRSLASLGGQALYGVLFYLGKTVWPAGLSPVYETADTVFPGARLVGMGGLVATGVWVLVRSARRRPAVGAAGVVYLVLLAPYLGIADMPSLVNDRYSYLACLAWAALVGAGYRRWVAGGVGGRGARVAAVAVLGTLVALTWRQCGVWREPETLWRHTLKVKPDSGIAHNNLGDALFQKGRWSEAADHFRASLALRPGHPETLNNLGAALLKQGDAAQAISFFQEAIRRRPGYIVTYNNLGAALAAVGRWDEAEAQYREVARLAPGNPQTLNNLADLEERRGRVREAIALYRQAVERDPDAVSSRLTLGAALAQHRRLPEAVTVYEEILLRWPRHLGALNELGLLWARRGDDEKAAVFYEDALRADPAAAVVRYNLLQARLRQRRWDDALRECDALLALKVSRPEVLNLRGVALSGAGRLDEAAAAFEQSIAEKPGAALPHKNLGVVCLKQGKTGLAIKHLREALRLQPDLGDVRDTLRRLDPAIRHGAAR